MNNSSAMPSVEKIPFTLTAKEGDVLFCDARFPSNAAAQLPVIIFTHGFNGFKEWGSIPYVCESLAQRGFYVVSFNFSHNGVEGNGVDFTRLDKFATNTFSREVRELGDVVDAVVDGETPRPEFAAPDHVGLVGHSRGGGVVLLEASTDERVRAVATWAAVADFNRYSQPQLERWRAAGYLENKNMRAGQIMRLDISLLNDLERNAEILNITRAAADLERPLLILHGEQDLTVRIEDGERLAAAADPNLTEFVPIAQTAHTFGAVHPFEGSNPALEFAIDRTAGFLKKFLAVNH